MEPVNVYVRKEDVGDSEYDDIWDDELLIKAYNKSVKGIKQKIAQRMGVINGTSDDESEKPSKSNSSKVHNGGFKKGQSKKKWEIGDYCRAVYSVDGLEYEAQILNILSDGQCVVEYSGYGNKQVVKMKDLKKSLGVKSRTAQKHSVSSRLDNEDAHISENYNLNNSSNISEPPLPGIPAVPPPPAFSLTSKFHQENESDALSAMLMSWYMSGYHTGYYQGLMQAKKQNQKSSDSKN